MNKNLQAALVISGVVTGLLAISVVTNAASLTPYARMPHNQQMMQQIAPMSASGHGMMMSAMMTDPMTMGGHFGGRMGTWGGQMMSAGHMMNSVDWPHHRSGNSSHCW